MDFDVIICGCGPAGAVLTHLLSKHGLNVCVIDRRHLDSPSGTVGKACGGLLSPDAQKALSRIGYSLSSDIISSPQIFSVNTIDLKSGLSRFYQRCYININRELFDRDLASLSPDACHIFGALVKSIKSEGDGASVTLKDGRVLTARFIIGADGSMSVVRKFLFPRFKVKSYVAVQQLFNCTQTPNRYSAVFDERITPYSGWTFIKDGTTYVGGAFTDKNPSAALDTMIARLREKGYTLENPIRREGTMLLRPCALLPRPVCAKGHVALIGEAAGMVSPSSAEGISFAINSAVLAAQSIISTGSLRRYATTSLALRLKLFNKNFKLPFMYLPCLRRLILKTGVYSIKNV